jgi:hypothetical protein
MHVVALPSLRGDTLPAVHVGPPHNRHTHLEDTTTDGALDGGGGGFALASSFRASELRSSSNPGRTGGGFRPVTASPVIENDLDTGYR